LYFYNVGKLQNVFENQKKIKNILNLFLKTNFIKENSYICISLKYKDMNVNKLKGLIAEKGFTKESFAKMLGMSGAGLSYIIKNKRTDTDTLLKMCEVLDVEPQILLK